MNMPTATTTLSVSIASCLGLFAIPALAATVITTPVTTTVPVATAPVTTTTVTPVATTTVTPVATTSTIPLTTVAATAPSTTVVEQHSDGRVATITATPNSIGMQDATPVVSPVVGTAVAPAAVAQTTTTQQVVGNQVVTTQQTTSTPTLTSLQLAPVFSTPGVIAADTKVMKVMRDGSGREFLVPARDIKPGDIIEYQTTYLNSSTQPVADVQATINLPNGVKLVSLNTPLQTLATVGGDSYQTISQVGNTTVIRTTETTPLNTYSGLRWNLVDLAPNASRTVTMRAVVQ